MNIDMIIYFWTMYVLGQTYNPIVNWVVKIRELPAVRRTQPITIAKDLNPCPIATMVTW